MRRSAAAFEVFLALHGSKDLENGPGNGRKEKTVSDLRSLRWRSR